MRRKKTQRPSSDDPYSLSKKLLKQSHGEETASTIYTRTNAGFVVEEGFLDSLYEPRTITALLLFLVFTVYAPFQITTHHMEAGIIAGCSMFIFYGAIQFRDGLLMRPHPMVWRVVHAIGILYLVFLAFCLYQPLADIRSKIIPMAVDASDEVDLTRSYGRDCVMFRNGTMNAILENTIFDIFVLMHGFGFVVNALLLRNWAMLWTVSIMFEVLEATLQHILPNFQECWWDHLLLDIFGFNLLGMVCGIWLGNRLATGLFDWGGQPYRKLPSRRKKIKRIVWQLFPHKFERYHWSILVDFRRFCGVFMIISFHLINVVNSFFIKHLLVLPTSSPLCYTRLVIIALVGVPACHEAYEFAIAPKAVRKHARLGQNAWVLLLVLTLESMWLIKNIPDELLQLPSTCIIICWVLSAVLFTCWVVYQYYVLPRWVHPWLRDLPVERASTLTTRLERMSLTFLALSIMPLMYILARDCYRTYVYAEDPASLAPIGQGHW